MGILIRGRAWAHATVYNVGSINTRRDTTTNKLEQILWDSQHVRS